MRNNNDSHGHDNPTPIPDTGRLYETRDVSLSAIAKWVAFLFVFVAGAASVTWVLFRFVYVPGGEEKSQFPLTYSRQLPPGPRLQANAVQDIKDYRQNEFAAINGYGRDPRTGAIHIPIDRAMTLVLPELPIRPGAGPVDMRATTQPYSPPIMDGKDAGSGVPPTSGTMDGSGNGGYVGQGGVNSERGTKPTPNAPGVSTPSPTNGNGTNSGGGLPLPLSDPNSTGQH